MIKTFGIVEDEVLKQMQAAMEKSNATYGVLCADNHLGYSVPVGGVLALEGAICVNGVGYDIACGNKAVCLDCDAEDVKKNIYRNMNEIQKHISFGVGRVNNEPVECDLFDDPLWGELRLLRDVKDKAMAQLGTVGSGNHYVDIFIDDLERVWVGVHFGSRGLGHTIATHFVNAGGGKDGVHADPVIFSETSELGEQYIKCMELAGRYAYAGRDWVCQRVAQILRGNIIQEVHNHHNFAWRERHFDRDMWVIRKGSTPAFPGQKGFVGGSMGDISVILRGVESQLSRDSLFSTIHGAGRAMGRTAAKGKRDKRGNITKPGLISRDAMQDWIKAKGVELRGADVDEAPQAYKRIEEVLQAHQGTIEILHTLNPIGVCMADSRTNDPYKD
jgi:tRNA-splicing ligase RtcB (3'-phosphate/5'-hydroxy nucleic acid ligase)